MTNLVFVCDLILSRNIKSDHQSSVARGIWKSNQVIERLDAAKGDKGVVICGVKDCDCRSINSERSVDWHAESLQNLIIV